MTVHGAKGLQAPIVLPARYAAAADTGAAAAVERRTACRCGGARDCDAPALEPRAGARRGAATQEYRRLLYVALTRAEDRLYVCGWRDQARRAAGNAGTNSSRRVSRPAARPSHSTSPATAARAGAARAGASCRVRPSPR